VIGIALLGDSSVVISAKPWVRVGDFGPAGAEINQALVAALGARGIEIPLPKLDVRLLGRD
jgi:small-conductance mechanosensitive channel